MWEKPCYSMRRFEALAWVIDANLFETHLRGIELPKGCCSHARLACTWRGLRTGGLTPTITVLPLYGRFPRQAAWLALCLPAVSGAKWRNTHCPPKLRDNRGNFRGRPMAKHILFAEATRQKKAFFRRQRERSSYGSCFSAPAGCQSSCALVVAA